MNILHLNSENAWRGGEQQLASLILGLNEKLNHNQFVMGRKGSALETWCLNNDIHFTSASFRGSADLNTSYKISKLCKKFNIDIMHAHTSHAHAAALYSKYLLNKSLLILHRRVSFPIKTNLVSRFKYRSSHICKIICVSKDVQRVLTIGTKQSDKTIVIYDAVNTNRFQTNVQYKTSFRERYSLPESQFIIANTAALAPEKDYRTFIKTAEKCIKNGLDAVFLIVGAGSEKEEIERYIRKKELTKNVFMLGFVSDIHDVLKHTDLILVTSKKEGLGSSILDSFYMRTPVVATATGGIPEIVKHHETGLLAHIADHHTLANHIQTLLKDSEITNNIIESAYSLVTEKYLIKNTVEQTEYIYLQIFESRS